MKPAIGRNENGAILILDSGWAATRFYGQGWRSGIHVSANEVFNGSFADVDEPEASMLLAEARSILAGGA